MIESQVRVGSLVEILGMTVELKREPSTMKVEIPKRFAVQLFACAREAERSVAFAQLGPDQWVGLCDYYQHEKRELVRELVDRLERLVPAGAPLAERGPFLEGTLTWLVRRPWVLLTNRTRLKWRFTLKDLIFIRQTLNCLLETLPLEPAPPALILYNLRMDCFTCEQIIVQRLEGIPELERALRVEHFCQSDYLEHVRIVEFFEYEKTSGPSTGTDAPKANPGRPGNPEKSVA